MQSKYSKESVQAAVQASKSYAETIRNLGCGLTGGTNGHVRQLIFEYGIDTSHFDAGSSKRQKAIKKRKKPWQEVLVLLPVGSNRTAGKVLRRALVESGREDRCEKCGNVGDWLGEKLTLQVDHINQQPNDNRPTNLCLLCPNCHSQKPVIKRNARRCACGSRLAKGSTRCASCYKEMQRELSTRPSKDTLGALLWEKPTKHIAKDLGVSDTQVAKWAKQYGLAKPPRGYWQKLKAGKV